MLDVYGAVHFCTYAILSNPAQTRILSAIPQFYQLDHQNTTIKMYRIVASLLGTSPIGVAGCPSTHPVEIP